MEDYIYKKDLEAMINRILLDCMMTPAIIGAKKLNGDPMNLTEMSAYNSAICIHNEGAREMATRLKAELAGDQDG